MAFNLFLFNLTTIAKAKTPFVNETCVDTFYNLQLKIAN